MDNLSRNEMEALRVLWNENPLKPAQIQERFSWFIENSTLRSVLRNLVDRKYLKRRKKGKAFYYRVKIRQQSVLSNMVKYMAHVFSQGSTTDLVAQFIKNEELSEEEMRELREIVESTSSTKSSDRKARGKP